MAEPRKPDEQAGERVREQAAPTEKQSSKTLQELERLQFDALDRTSRTN